MRIDGVPYRTIWPVPAEGAVAVLDQTVLPHRLEVRHLRSLEDTAHAIRTMVVRGAPLIGATAAYGLALAMRDQPSDDGLIAAAATLKSTRPTAVNLRWAVDRVRVALHAVPPAARANLAFELAAAVCDEDVAINEAIGRHGLPLIEAVAARKSGRGPVQVLTHCNAGWLAAVDWGTATAPIYAAHEAGIPLHVWVDETRPRNQGAALTAWELGKHGVPHTVIVDNAGGHLMQRGMVDLCLVGTDRTTATGDVANKIGTYLKALAARDNDVPFYVALPSPTIDWSLGDGRAIPIETRDPEEVTFVGGVDRAGSFRSVRITPEGSPALNPAFDVTPARLVTGLVTERGVAEASRAGLAGLFPEIGTSEAA